MNDYQSGEVKKNGAQIVLPVVKSGVGYEQQSKVVRVSPALAASWLESTPLGQRSIRRNSVDSYARDMRAGNWRLTHQGIAFNKAGDLIDGQHRLNAVVKSGCSVMMLVTWNVDADVSDPIDVGIGRTLTDQMGRGNQWVATVGALARLQIGRLSNVRLTLDEVKLCEAQNVQALGGCFITNGRRSIVTSGVMAGAAYAWPIAPVEVERFLQQVSTSEMLKRGDPAFSFRNWLQGNHRRAISTVEIALATLGVIDSFLRNRSHLSVYVGESAYRRLSGTRRAMGIPNTPTSQQVPIARSDDENDE